MRWNRLVAILGGVLMGVSAFLTWFQLDTTKFSANDIPALILFRYAATATGLRLGYVLIVLGLGLIAASFLRPPIQGAVVLVIGALGLGVVIDFTAQLLREINSAQGSGSLLDYLKYGAFVAGVGGLLSLVAAFGGLARAEVPVGSVYPPPPQAHTWPPPPGSASSPWDSVGETSGDYAAHGWSAPPAPPAPPVPNPPSRANPATEVWSPPPPPSDPWQAPSGPGTQAWTPPGGPTQTWAPPTEVTPTVGPPVPPQHSQDEGPPCKSCGRPTEPGRNFCRHCGTAVT